MDIESIGSAERILLCIPLLRFVLACGNASFSSWRLRRLYSSSFRPWLVMIFYVTLFGLILFILRYSLQTKIGKSESFSLVMSMSYRSRNVRGKMFYDHY
jgi:hypothetical protein